MVFEMCLYGATWCHFKIARSKKANAATEDLPSEDSTFIKKADLGASVFLKDLAPKFCTKEQRDNDQKQDDNVDPSNEFDYMDKDESLDQPSAQVLSAAEEQGAMRKQERDDSEEDSNVDGHDDVDEGPELKQENHNPDPEPDTQDYIGGRAKSGEIP